MVSDAFWEAGPLVVENASKLSFFYRDPERPFDTDHPRNWGSFGAELNGLKPWRRGGFRCFLGGWLVVENARKVFFLGIQSVRLTPNVRGIGARLEFDTERPRNWGSFGAELNGLKPWRRGGFRCSLGGWKAFGRLLVEAFWEAG